MNYVTHNRIDNEFYKTVKVSTIRQYLSSLEKKVIDGKNTVICKANNESTARKIVEKLRECNWNKEKINEIIEKVEA